MSEYPLFAGFTGLVIPSVAMFTQYIRHPDVKSALAISVLWIAALAYLVMATGACPIVLVRHIDWLVTTPLLLVDLGIVSKAPVHEIVIAVVADVLMIAAGYAVVVTPSSYLAYWSIGMLFFAVIVRFLLKWRDNALNAQKAAFSLTLAVWTVYPFLFFIDEANALTLWAYAAVDITSKAGVGALIVF